MLLSVEGLSVAYGAIQALHGISFEVEQGEMVTLIGANGAGKSTTLWTLVRQIHELGGRVTSGRVSFRGQDLLKYSAHDVVNRLGISLVPEGRRVFGNLTVLENLRLAAYSRRDHRAVGDDLQRVFSLFPRLAERQRQLADLLSGGEQQMLAVGRALMNRGELMLLDEPSMGLAPVLVQELFRTLVEINNDGTTMLLVEQNAHMALKHAHRAYVIETGNIVLSGPADEIAENPEVKAAYLGG
jgi:branched-chain amino acid transport system ATP-binding protein